MNEAVAAGSRFRDGPLPQLADDGRVTTDYSHWYSHARLRGEPGRTPEEYEQVYYAAHQLPPGKSSHRKTAWNPGRFIPHRRGRGQGPGQRL